MKKTPSVILVVVAACCGYIPFRAANASSQRVSDAQVRGASIRIADASLPKVVSTVAETFRLNIIADSYLTDLHMKDIRAENALYEEFIPGIAEMYQRDVLTVGGSIVLRHHDWYIQQAREQAAQRSRGLAWKNAGSISILRLEHQPQVAAVAARHLNADANSKPGQIGKLPARLISVHVESAPVREIAKRFTVVTGWKLTVARELADRRVTVAMARVTPSQFVEALSWLLNGAQEIAIGKSEAQKEEEAKKLAFLESGETELDRQSNELLEGILHELTPAQRDAMSRGEQVGVPINSLSPSLRQKALNYAESSAKDLLGRSPGFDVDLSRKSEFKIVILPPPSTQLGVGGYSTSGGYIQY